MSKMNNEFKKAESKGQIKTMPEAELELPIQEEKMPEIISNPEEFRMAIGHAQMEGLDFIEVSENLFKYLLKKSKSKYLTYGNPGIKVYQVGTREEIEKEEGMGAEQHHDYIHRKNIDAK